MCLRHLVDTLTITNLSHREGYYFYNKNSKKKKKDEMEVYLLIQRTGGSVWWYEQLDIDPGTNGLYHSTESASTKLSYQPVMSESAIRIIIDMPY